MKTLTPTNLIAVEVPKDARNAKIYDKLKIPSLKYFIGNLNWESQLLPIGNFEILGEVTDTEIYFDVLPYVDEIDNAYWYSRGFPFIDYTNDSNCFKTKEESFRSLLQSNGWLWKKQF